MTQPITLSANGKGHRALTFLAAEGPAIMGAIRVSAGVEGPKARRLYFLIGLLVDRGLIHRNAEGYHITDDGLAALEVLDGGRDFVIAPDAVPNVRVFGRAA